MMTQRPDERLITVPAAATARAGIIMIG